MKLNRSLACALTGAALIASVFAAPASAAGGTIIVPTSSAGCDKDVVVWWDTTRPPYVGTSGNVSC